MFKDFFIKLKAKREIKKLNGRNKMIRKKELLERIKELEERVNCIGCYLDKLYDENEHLLYHLNTILGRNPACADPLPYDSSVDALCEILERLKRSDETKKKISESLKGRKKSEEHIEKHKKSMKGK